MTLPREEQTPTGLGGAEMFGLFPMPVLRYQWPDSDRLNADLRDVVLARMARSPGVHKTNRGGWQSEPNLEKWDEEPVRVLMGRIEQMVQEMVRRTVPDPEPRHLTGWRIRAWANANRKGHFNRTHHHVGPHSHWSGIYYVDVGELNTDQPVSGSTVFEDRSLVAKEVFRNPDPFEREFRIRPRNGLSVLFPPGLRHSVEPYSGEGTRVTIAYNLWHAGFTVPMYEELKPPPGWWWRNFRGVMLLLTRARVVRREPGVSGY